MNLRRFISLLPIALAIANCFVTESRSATPPARPKLACATIGNVVLEFPSAYQFFPLSYEGIDYWRGEASKQWEKGCRDRASQIALSTSWPDLKPPDKRFYETSRDPDLISIVLDANKAKDPSAALEKIRNYHISPDSKPATDEVSRQYRAREFPFDKSLGLFKSGPIQTRARYQKLTYWSVNDENKIEILILCELYRTGSMTCDEMRFSKRIDVWINVKFRGPLLPEWREMARESESLINNFIKKD
jgi:hypothetical protein